MFIFRIVFGFKVIVDIENLSGSNIVEDDLFRLLEIGLLRRKRG